MGILTGRARLGLLTGGGAIPCVRHRSEQFVRTRRRGSGTLKRASRAGTSGAWAPDVQKRTNFMRKRWWLAGILVLAAGLGFEIPQANAQYFGQNKVQYRQYKWSSIESDHFDVYYYPGLDSLAKRVLDLAEKTNSYLSAKMGHTLGHRVPIILFGSHNDFAQTNVTPELIDAGTGGFTELLRNRVVIPFTGSYEELRHVLVHELTHATMFDLCLLYTSDAADERSS